MDKAYCQKSFQFWVSYYDTSFDLDDEERLAFYDAVFAYVFKDEDCEQTLKESGRMNAYFAFKGIKANLKTSKNRSECGRKGGRPSLDECDSSGDSQCDSQVDAVSEKQTESKRKQNESKRKANGKQTESKDKEKEKVKDKAKDKEKDKSARAYGEFGNVMLTDDELAKLKSRVQGLDQLIESMSRYLASSGKRYKSHYAALLNWARRDGLIVDPSSAPRPPGMDEGLFSDFERWDIEAEEVKAW